MDSMRYCYQVVLKSSRLRWYQRSRKRAKKELGHTSAQHVCLESKHGDPVSRLVDTHMPAYLQALHVGMQKNQRHGWHTLSTIVREETMRGLLGAVVLSCVGGR
ncbi:hypothetical protein BD309DRAFT_763013 [Dichomitus squalens]|nr:hypothetical protein BD309DRAFT_763013 [Dichomitus squalens]